MSVLKMLTKPLVKYSRLTYGYVLLFMAVAILSPMIFKRDFGHLWARASGVIIGGYLYAVIESTIVKRKMRQKER